MSALLATVNRELRAYFFSPLAYIVLTCLLVVHGITFCLLVSFLSDPRSPAAPPMQFFFGATDVTSTLRLEGDVTLIQLHRTCV